MTSAKVAAVAALFALGMSSGTVAGIATAAAGQASKAGQVGKASWYKMGTRTASGEKMNARGLTAAHRTLPFGTRVKVENLRNGRVVVVRINDRGPFTGGRVIDVTQRAAEVLDMVRSGVANVRVSVLE